MKYLDVVVENKSRHTDSFFTYRAPDETELRIGDKVWVPFGRGDKTKAGFVFAFPEHISCPEQKIKEIEGVDAAGSLNREMMKTAAWMKQRYAITYSDAISCFCVKGNPPREGKAKEPYKDLPGRDERPAALTEEQTASVECINEAIAASRHEIFLLHGVTASGKTEVYMEAIDKCLKLDKTAIMLVPEIALTNQIMEHFIGRFGKDRLAVMHSKLTPRERYDEWHRIRSGRARIVIGARMGVFAPAENIGLIIMDEEHEATYKSDMTPKYDTVEVAAKRLQTTGGVLLLGSATPSVVSYERAKEGIYQLLTLKQRYNRNPLPRVEIVDMREELRAGNTNIFSRRLYSAIEETLKKGQQVILFQNRRGYSNFVSCRACGAVMKCPECDLSLVYHKKEHAMICHYCGYETPQVHACPSCGSPYIGGFRAGTQQIEQNVKKLFPKARVLRMDGDTTKTKNSYEEILSAFAAGKADILIGTQMIVKGHDFPNVTLVGALAADLSLNAVDYRAGERTFQLLTQAVGRAGRGEKPGMAVIQTYHPEHYSIQTAAEQDYGTFYEKEMDYRRLMGYPPAAELLAIHGAGEDEAHLTQAMEYIRRYLIRIRGNREVQIIGPASEAVSKINDLYRMAVYVRAPQEEVLAELREKLERYIEINKGFRTVYLQFDFSRKY